MSEISREEVEVALETRRELGAGLEPEIVDGFVDRIETAIDRRIDEKLAGRKLPARKKSNDGKYGVTFVSMGVSIPLLGIAQDSLVAMALVLAALVAINVIVWTRD